MSTPVIAGHFWKRRVVGSKPRVHIENGQVTHCGHRIDIAGDYLDHAKQSELCRNCVQAWFMNHILSGEIQL